MGFVNFTLVTVPEISLSAFHVVYARQRVMGLQPGQTVATNPKVRLIISM